MQSYKDLNIDYQGGDLKIDIKKLTSLGGCPNHITWDFDCYANSLTSLVCGPQQVDGHYSCQHNQLTDLVGCASHIGGILNCCYNNITSLVGIHKIIKSCNEIWFDDLKIVHGGIGLLLVENLEVIHGSPEQYTIFNRYLGTGTKGMMACRDELIKKGLEEYAKL